MKKLKNKFERKLAKQLNRYGSKFTYEGEAIPYVLSRRYYPDFVIRTDMGLLYIEAKGYLRPEHKAKMIAVKRQHPEKDIRIIFYARNKKNEKWAMKNGFQYAFSNIPKDWLI